MQTLYKNIPVASMGMELFQEAFFPSLLSSKKDWEIARPVLAGAEEIRPIYSI